MVACVWDEAPLKDKIKGSSPKSSLTMVEIEWHWVLSAFLCSVFLFFRGVFGFKQEWSNLRGKNIYCRNKMEKRTFQKLRNYFGEPSNKFHPSSYPLHIFWMRYYWEKKIKIKNVLKIKGLFCTNINNVGISNA